MRAKNKNGFVHEDTTVIVHNHLVFISLSKTLKYCLCLLIPRIYQKSSIKHFSVRVKIFALNCKVIEFKIKTYKTKY